MKRSIITTDGNGNIIMPTDISATAMSEWELCALFEYLPRHSVQG